MITEVERGGVIFSDLTYPTAFNENKHCLFVKAATEKDFLSNNKIAISLSITYRCINKGSNKIIDVLKSQVKYRIKIKDDISLEELYTKVYLRAMEHFITALKEKDIDNEILKLREINPLTFNDLKADLIALSDKIGVLIEL